MLVQRVENLFGQLHGGGHDRNAAALDVRFGADMFGHVESPLEGTVQTRAGGMVLQRDFVGLLELAEDLGLADDHGVQAAGDFEQVLQAVRFSQRINFVIHHAVESVVGDEEFFQLGECPLGGERCGGVDLHAVAGREDGRFAGDAGFAQGPERAGDGGLGKGEALAQLHGRGAVAQTNDDNAHG